VVADQAVCIQPLLLTGLYTYAQGLRSLWYLHSGDCVVAFSRKDIYTLKRRIEKNLGLKCCVVYGSLPPETRKAQAELFNAPDNGYDVLVASGELLSCYRINAVA